MYIFEEYLLSLSYFKPKLDLKILILSQQLNVRARASIDVQWKVLPPPPLITPRSDRWPMQFKFFFFITTYINDAHSFENTTYKNH